PHRRRPRRSLSRRTLPRLPLAVRRLRDPCRRGDGIRMSSRHEPRDRDCRGRRRCGRPRRPHRRCRDRGRDRGGGPPSRRARAPRQRAGAALHLGAGRGCRRRVLSPCARMSADPLVVIDADVLGRLRTGDESYVRNLLRCFGEIGETGLRIAAVTRHPELVPTGVEALPLETRVQELRMAWALPRLLRRCGAALVHTQYALPLRVSCPVVVTIHDLSFERDAALMGRKDRFVFRRVVPLAARKAARVLTVSERSKRDLVELYGIAPERIVVTSNGVDPIFRPGPGSHDYVLAVGAV